MRISVIRRILERRYEDLFMIAIDLVYVIEVGDLSMRYEDMIHER